MTDEELAKLRGVEWMSSRIPVMDALCTFHPGLMADGTDYNPELTADLRRWPEARWYPLDCGFRVLVPNVGPVHDPKTFSVEVGGWDHSTCDNCNVHIPAMTLCWVTRRDPYFAFCEDCYEREIRRYASR